MGRVQCCGLIDDRGGTGVERNEALESRDLNENELLTRCLDDANDDTPELDVVPFPPHLSTRCTTLSLPASIPLNACCSFLNLSQSFTFSSDMLFFSSRERSLFS